MVVRGSIQGASKRQLILSDALRSSKKQSKKNFELIKLNNVVATPHIGSQTKESQNSASVILANKILRYFENTN